jgi:hypothetical protein
MPLKFTPGRKSARNFANLYKYNVYEEHACACIQEEAKNTNNGWNIPNLSRAEKISLDVLYYPGGRIQFGNGIGEPIPTNIWGRAQGQLGGSLQALRNRF